MNECYISVLDLCIFSGCLMGKIKLAKVIHTICMLSRLYGTCMYMYMYIDVAGSTYLEKKVE